MKPPKYTSLPTRFWDKVAEPNENGCWLWTGRRSVPSVKTKTSGAYGRVMYMGVQMGAHRLFAADAKGEIPKGMHVLHSCDVKHCVNPDHLRYGTHKDNMRDMAVRKRAHHQIGAANGHAVFTEEQVLEVRALYKTGKYVYREIAEKFGVSLSAVRDVILRKNWAHLP